MTVLVKIFPKKVCQNKKAFYLCTRFEGQVSTDIF